MTRAPTPNPLAGRLLRAPILWGVIVGAIQAASPLGLWWLDPATVYALSLTLIAAVYIQRSRLWISPRSAGGRLTEAEAGSGWALAAGSG
jgi:hypothetical protein